MTDKKEFSEEGKKTRHDLLQERVYEVNAGIVNAMIHKARKKGPFTLNIPSLDITIVLPQIEEGEWCHEGCR